MMRSGTLTERTVDSLYQKGASFVDFMPWVEYQPESKTLLLDDGRSVGAVYDITPFGTEGRSPARLEELRDILKDALQDSFTEYDRHPWVVQFYCRMRTIPQAGWPRCMTTPYRKHGALILPAPG